MSAYAAGDPVIYTEYGQSKEATVIGPYPPGHDTGRYEIDFGPAGTNYPPPASNRDIRIVWNENLITPAGQRRHHHSDTYFYTDEPYIPE